MASTGFSGSDASGRGLEQFPFHPVESRGDYRAHHKVRVSVDVHVAAGTGLVRERLGHEPGQEAMRMRASAAVEEVDLHLPRPVLGLAALHQDAARFQPVPKQLPEPFFPRKAGQVVVGR